MHKVRAKKRLGQHFLCDENVILDIVESAIKAFNNNVLEVGPGTGALTKHLLSNKQFNFHAIEVDDEAYDYLLNEFPQLKTKLIKADFLQHPIESIFNGPYDIIGNFPYNISSQILFKVLQHRQNVGTVIGMFQKEVADRIISGPNNKSYGILSLFMQAYYDIEYLFTVHENAFSPPPKIKSAVLKFTRNKTKQLDCDEKLFFSLIKTTFNHRRKMLRNTLKSFNIIDIEIVTPYLTKRPENLSVDDFVLLTKNISRKEPQ